MEENVKSQFLALYCMILADGVIDAREMKTLYKIGMEDYGLSTEEINSAVQEQGTSFKFPTTIEGKVKFLYHMCVIAWADGVIDETEKNMVQKYAIRMGFDENNAEQIADYLLQQVKDNVCVDDIIAEIKK